MAHAAAALVAAVEDFRSAQPFDWERHSLSISDARVSAAPSDQPCEAAHTTVGPAPTSGAASGCLQSRRGKPVPECFGGYKDQTRESVGLSFKPAVVLFRNPALCRLPARKAGKLQTTVRLLV